MPSPLSPVLTSDEGSSQIEDTRGTEADAQTSGELDLVEEVLQHRAEQRHEGSVGDANKEAESEEDATARCGEDELLLGCQGGGNRGVREGDRHDAVEDEYSAEDVNEVADGATATTMGQGYVA